MTESERAECKAYLNKQLVQISVNLDRANARKNNEAERTNLLRKATILKNLLKLVENDEQNKC